MNMLLLGCGRWEDHICKLFRLLLLKGLGFMHITIVIIARAEAVEKTAKPF